MPEVRVEYPFQISYEDARLPRSLVVLRAETAEDLGRQLAEAQAALETVLGTPEPEAAAESPQEVAPPPAKPAFVKPAGPANRPIATLPPEALQALLMQKKPLCACNDKWWNNTLTKTKATQPDFKCCKCNMGIWLTALKSEE